MQLQAKSRLRMQSVGQAKFIARACKRVATKLKSNKGLQRMATETPGQRKYAWAQSIAEDNPFALTPLLPQLPKPPLWEEPTAEQLQSRSAFQLARAQRQFPAIS